MFFLAVGNPFDGMQLIGPFKTSEDAEEYAGDFTCTDWWVVNAQEPKYGC